MKKILVLLGYLIGIVVGSKFAKKPAKKGVKPETIGDWAKDAGEEILSVHSRLMDRAKKEYLTDENKQFLLEKKEGLLLFLEDFKGEALEKIDELKDSGSDLTKKGEAELKKMYENRAIYLEKAGNLGKKALASAQEMLDEVYDDVKKKVPSKPKKKAPAKKKTTAKKKPAPKKK